MSAQAALEGRFLGGRPPYGYRILLDVNDVAAGYETRMCWNQAGSWIWSDAIVHEPLISAGDFEAAQAIMADAGRARRTTTVRQLTEDDIRAIITGLGDLHDIIRDAEPSVKAGRKPAGGLALVSQHQRDRSGQRASSDLARQAWHWALASRDEHGALPSGGAIARAHGRKERWGRLVKRAGVAGAFDAEGARESSPRDRPCRHRSPWS